MNKRGPVIIIEDDDDDQQFFSDVFTKLKYPNKVIFFNDGEAALHYLTTTDVLPFLILSDINMPRLNGFELRAKLKTDAALQVQCIPCLLFSAVVDQKAVVDAYSLSVQGFFVKHSSTSEMEKTITAIMEYWLRCSAPNNFR